MNFILKKTFCYEPIAEALNFLSKNVIVWDDTISLKEIINSYNDLFFIGIYEQCRESTIRMLNSYQIKSMFITDKKYDLLNSKDIILNPFNSNPENKYFYEKNNVKYIESFWPFQELVKLKYNNLYSADLAFLYDCDYSKMMKHIIPLLEKEGGIKISTWGNSEIWPWMRHNGIVNEYNMIEIISSSKKIAIPKNADKRYIIKTLCHGGNPAILDDECNEVDFDKSEYEKYNSIEFLKEVGKYLC